MTIPRWIVLAVLVASMVAVQKYGLDPAPETREEAPFKNLSQLPASDVVPTYIASLFFGAFRALAVDYLWIRLKSVEEERRWYERREILMLISALQPRNPEVRAHLGWHSAYNVANGFNDEKSGRWDADSKAWEWTRFGLHWLRDGIVLMPEEAYLKFELARTLAHKPSWRRGKLDLALLERIEKDEGLQRILAPPGPYTGPRSAFELAIEWLRQAREEILKAHQKHQMTQMGLYLYSSSMDGFIREAHYLQAMYERKRNRFQAARDWLLRAAEHTERMLQTEYPEPLTELTKEWPPFYRGLADVLAFEERAGSGTPEDERAYLAALQRHLTAGDPMLATLDDGFFWLPGNPEAPLNRMKIKASGGKDLQECNDAPRMAWELNPGDLALANLEPAGMDVDYYLLWLKAPQKDDDGHGHDRAPRKPDHPLEVKLLLDRTEAGKMDLKITVTDSLHRVIKEGEARGRQEIRFEAPNYGTYYVKVEPLGTPSPWPPDTGYKFRYEVEE